MSSRARRGAERKKDEKSVFFFPNFFILLTFFARSRLDCKQVGQTVNVNGDVIQCRQQDILDQATRNVLLRVLDDMTKYVAELLYIVRANSVTVTGRWCFDPSLDISRYSSPQTSFDAMMMITSWPTEGGTVAWASGCRSDQFGRSTAGHMNFGPGAVGGRSYKMIYATALHELFHALGFSGNRFPRMLAANGQTFNGVSRVSLGDAQSGVKTTTIISSPRVVAEARAHLGCNTIQGIEIEDDGGSGSGGSHWEQRVVGNEVMAPSIPSTASAMGPLVSRLTLALFEDLGVYYPDYSKVTGNYVYGRGQGCGFYQRPSRERREQYQCPRTLRSNKCNPDLTGYSSCQWSNYGQQLPLFEQPDTNFPTQGGNQFSDYAVEAQAWTSCRGGTLPTQNGQNGGANSFCLMNSVAAGNFRRDLGAGCFELRCPGAGARPPAPTNAPAPNQPATQRPAPTNAPTNAPPPTGGNRGPALREFDCGECQENRGRWCDGGWALPNLDRYGACIDPQFESCPSWAPKAVNNAEQCYPACNYGSQYVGTCRGASWCAAAGGVRVSGARGATGCANEPAQYISCCITHRVVGKRAALEEAAAPVAVEEAPLEHEKRQAGHSVRVGTNWVQCPAAGGLVNVGGGFSGQVQCPSLEAGCCASKNYCNGRGLCHSGNCICNGPWYGDSCQTPVPSGAPQAPNRGGQRVNNYLVEEDFPEIDKPAPTETGTPVELPFGNELGIDGEEDLFGMPGGNNATTAPASGPLHPGIIVAIVVVVVLVILVAAGAGFYVVKRRRAATSA